MTHERVAQLETLGFAWRDPNQLPWDQIFEELKSYKEENGDCFVPHKYPPNPQLGTWVTKQRTHYHIFMESKKQAAGSNSVPCGSHMTEERIARLEALGFAWSGNSNPRYISWDTRYGELVAYKEEHGDCLVPNQYPSYPKLGHWVTTQRTHYRLKWNPEEPGSPFEVARA